MILNIDMCYMNNVTIYTSSTCPHCISAKKYLDDRDIEYTEKNVSTDQTAQLELQKLGVMGVPSFNINGEIIVGLDRLKIEKALLNKIIICPSCSSKLRVPNNKGKIKVTCKKCDKDFVVD